MPILVQPLEPYAGGAARRPAGRGGPGGHAVGAPDHGRGVLRPADPRPATGARRQARALALGPRIPGRARRAARAGPPGAAGTPEASGLNATRPALSGYLIVPADLTGS